jgi:hypothetical protein
VGEGDRRPFARHAHHVSERAHGTAEGELDCHRTGRVADQPVLLVQGEPVEGARAGHAHGGQARASVVLQQGLCADGDDLEGRCGGLDGLDRRWVGGRLGGLDRRWVA